LVIPQTRKNAVNPGEENEAMKMTAKRNATRKQAGHGDLTHRSRSNDVKGGIIIVNSVPQVRAWLNPITIRGLNPQPLPPR
jgi:hypothetical protein